uniref:Chemokine interleukin-8-like domain-containing protein n=1 Tax=Neogobius melanostomus TaxID=47308 RepID=A0A8C6SJB3_9GOBI
MAAHHDCAWASEKENECCFHFYVDRLPKNKVDDYRLTSPHCPNKGIIVRMQNGKEFCVNPDQRWLILLLCSCLVLLLFDLLKC